MRTMFLLSLLIGCCQVNAQSIMISGNRSSIVASGVTQRIETPAPQPVATTTVVVKSKITTPVVAKAKRREWYLVSEPWCTHCPAAKRRFLSLGWPATNILTIAECERRFGFRPSHVPFEFGDPSYQVTSQVVVKELPQKQRQSVSRYYNYRGTNYDLETYSRPGCHCPMCNEIKWQQSLYFQQRNQTAIEQPEHASPPEIINKALDAMSLGPSDLLADLGCGTADVLIAAVRRFGCRAIGIEIDPEIADTARRRVLASGLSHLIEIITGDALNSCLTGVTCVYCYLYPDLLEKLAPQLSEVPRVISPFHEVPGLGMVRRGEVFIKQKKES